MISFVYFDLGGVVEIDLSPPEKWVKLKRDIGIKPNQDKEFEEFWGDQEPSLCIGDRDQDSLLPLLIDKFDLKLPKNYSMLVDFVSRFETNKSIWPVVDKIQESCRIGLLTNMYPRMLDMIKSRNILPKVNWDVVIDSSVVKLQKPDPRIFSLAEEKCDLRSKSVLFVDNSLKNVNSAKEFGWTTYHYDPVTPELSSKGLLDFFNKNS